MAMMAVVENERRQKNSEEEAEATLQLQRISSTITLSYESMRLVLLHCRLMLPQITAKMSSCRILTRLLRDCCWGGCRPSTLQCPAFSGYCLVDGNDRKTSISGNALFTNTAEFRKMHRASCKRIDATHTDAQIETWRRKADSSDYLLGNELSTITVELAVPLATRMLQRLFDYSFPISDYGCQPAMLLGRFAALQFDCSRMSGEIKPLQIRDQMVTSKSAHSKIAHLKQLGLSMNDSDTKGPFMSEAVNHFCSFMIFFKNGASVISKLAVVVGPHTAANHSVYTTSRLMAAATMKAVSQRCDYHITCDINTSRVQWLPLITVLTPSIESVCQDLVAVAVKKKYAKFLKKYGKKHAMPTDCELELCPCEKCGPLGHLRHQFQYCHVPGCPCLQRWVPPLF